MRSSPARPARTIVGGLALAVLLVAGAAIAGVFAPRDPQEWNKPGLVISKETGAAYVILEESSHPVLRPVINITSARLILPDGVEPTLVSQQTIDTQTIGDDIGILGAPASLPTPSLLIDGGWTACTGDGLGIRVDVARTPDVEPIPGSGFLVESKGVYYVIAEAAQVAGETVSAYRYELPRYGPARAATTRTTCSATSGCRSARAPRRSSRTGSPSSRPAVRWTSRTLRADRLRRAGVVRRQRRRPRRRPGRRRGHRGRRGQVPAAHRAGTHGPRPVRAGALPAHDDADGEPGADVRAGDSPVETTQDEPPTARQTTPPYDGAHWPDDLLDTVLDEQCAQAQDRSRRGADGGGAPPRPGAQASSLDVAAGRVQRAVDAGAGPTCSPATGATPRTGPRS